MHRFLDGPEFEASLVYVACSRPPELHILHSLFQTNKNTHPAVTKKIQCSGLAAAQSLFPPSLLGCPGSLCGHPQSGAWAYCLGFSTDEATHHILSTKEIPPALGLVHCTCLQVTMDEKTSDPGTGTPDSYERPSAGNQTWVLYQSSEHSYC